MGGEFEAASTPSEGSQFWFDLDLPEVPNHTAVGRRERTVIGITGERRRVLVVDDDEEEDHAVSRPQLPGDRSLPPTQQLEGLIELARRGDVKNLLAQASRLEQPGAGYAPFAAELRRLVEGFQMKQLREWLKSLGETS